jgi:hypothetical protein
MCKCFLSAVVARLYIHRWEQAEDALCEMTFHIASSAEQVRQSSVHMLPRQSLTFNVHHLVANI